jgi:integrase
MPAHPLSSQFVREALCPRGRPKNDFFDPEQKGLLLEVRSSGGKTFYQRYIDGYGRQRQFKLGSANVISIEQARRLGRSALAEALLGADPQARRQELRSIPTLNQLVRDRYLPHAQASKRSWNTDETLLRIHILPALGRLTVDQISGEHIAGLINDMRAKGYAGGTTNHILVLLRYVFNLARKWNVPGASANPTAGLATAPEVHRQRFLTPEETQRLVGSIRADKNEIAAKAILLLLLTGARRREVTRARWEDVDWEKRTLLVPVSKSGKPRTIALNAAAIALLRTAASDSASPYIFPTQLSGLFCPWNRIRRRAGLADVRLHDLRHSFASFLVNQGVSLYVVQNLLGHTQARMTQRYAHLAPQTLLDAAEVAAVVIQRGPPNGDASYRLPGA